MLTCSRQLDAVWSIRMSCILVLLVGLLAMEGAASEGGRERTKPAVASWVGEVSLVVDVTGSLDVQMPRGGTRRELVLDATRATIKAAERAGVPLIVARLCGIVETLFGPEPVRRKEFTALTAMIRSALASCDPSTTVVKSELRSAGTDIVKAIRWLRQRPDNALLVLLSDGLNTPPEQDSRLTQKPLHAALDKLSPQVRARLWILGVDEGVRDGIAARVPRTYGIFDMRPAIERLAQDIARGAR